MFRHTAKRLLQEFSNAGKRAPLTIENNPYTAKKVWPPNFADLSPQAQLRFEKKYKRRLYNAHYSEKWDKGVRILRFAMVSAALVYVLFFAEMELWGQKYKPSEEIVKKAATLFGIMDPEKRYERRKDAAPVNPKKEEEEASSK